MEETLKEDISNRLISLGTLQTRYVIEVSLNDPNLSKEEFDQNKELLESLMNQFKDILEHGEIFTKPELLALNLPAGTWTDKEINHFSWTPEAIGVLKWTISPYLEMLDYTESYPIEDYEESDWNTYQVRNKEEINKEIEKLDLLNPNDFDSITIQRIWCRLKSFEWVVAESENKVEQWLQLTERFGV